MGAVLEIIFAPPKTGKTAYLSNCLLKACFDSDRRHAMRREIALKNSAGFDLSVPQHCVSANYDLKLKKFGYSERKNRRINPFRLGFSNPFVETHFNFPYEVIGITEAQKYLNSRMSMYYPDWQSRWYEAHGHNDIDIYLDTQRPGLIDVNVRELATFTEILRVEPLINRYGRVYAQKFFIRRIRGNAEFERYISGGKSDKSLYQEGEEVSDVNIFEIYNFKSCKPSFYAGHFGSNYDYVESSSPEESMGGYISYLEKYDDEMPSGFYQKRGGSK